MPGILTRLSRHTAVFRLGGKLRVLFDKYLLLTNTLITVSLSGVGDLMQQYYEHLKNDNTQWDWRRSRNVCLSGFVIGPICHFWYLYLDRMLPGRTFRIVMKKVLADQIIISPICVASFLFVIGYSEGASKLQILDDLRFKGPALLKAEWLVWPPAQVINFLLLPTKYRVLYDNTISLGFDNYYSYVKYRRDKDSVSQMQASQEENGEYYILEARLPSEQDNKSKGAMDYMLLGKNICGNYYTYPQRNSNIVQGIE